MSVRLCRLAVLLLAGFLLAACSPRYLIVHSLASELAGQSNSPEEDLVLAREAGAFYLKLSESLLREVPDDLPLAEAVSGGFTKYAYAFIEQDADKLESTDSRAARKLHQRAARMYLRAHLLAMAALEHAQPGFGKALASADPKQWPLLTDKQVPVAYWAAASWGGYIALSKENPEVVADFPLALRLADLAWKKMPGFGDGALATLMGNFELARPDGNAARARQYFDTAIADAGDHNAGPWLAKAEGIALPGGDRQSFEFLLREALRVSESRHDVGNAVMRERAMWLLGNANDLF